MPTFIPLPMIDETETMSDKTLEFLEIPRLGHKRFVNIAKACDIPPAKLKKIIDRSHIKLSEKAAVAVSIGEYYYDEAADRMQDFVFREVGWVLNYGI